jgi:flagellar biosynthesis protein FlhF
MRKVRETFGPDAYIVSNREVEDGVEVLATGNLESLIEEFPDGYVSASNDGRAVGNSTAVRNASRGKSNRAKGQNLSYDVRDEISQLRGILEGLAQGGTLPGTGNENQLKISAQLMSIGIGTRLVQQLIDNSKVIEGGEVAERHVIGALQKLLPVEQCELPSAGGIAVFHGPGGSGKTTVIGKMAAQFLSSGGSTAAMALINTDNNGIGGNGRLDAIGATLGIPVFDARNEDELDEIFAQLRRKKLVLVDTPAINAYRTRADKLTALGSARRRIKHLMVVPGTWQCAAIDDLLALSVGVDIESTVLTRLDETAQPGIAIDCMIRSSAKVAFWADSARPQQSLNTPSTRCLVEYAFDQEGTTREEPVVEDTESEATTEQPKDEEADVDLTKFAGLSLEA